jgi:SAM-dependent methyltransferase
MESWVKEFYSKQNSWFGAYLGPIEAAHHSRAALVNEMTDPHPKKILELGAGGGQTAFALAQLGHELTTIELLEESVAHQASLEQFYQYGIQMLQGDFYNISLEQTFDLICYFDSFGIGKDAEQRTLLQRIATWLSPEGCAIIEVGSTWHWGGIAQGKEMDIGVCMRRHEFDPIESRIIDKWWPYGKPEQVMCQSLRCYTPADLNLLLEGTGLEIVTIRPGGKMDYRTGDFIPKVSLEEAMTYYVKLKKSTL